MTTRALPNQIGSLARQTALRIAEHALVNVAERGKSAKAKFALSIDAGGRVWLDKPDRAPTRELVVTFDRKSDPDFLAEELAHEWKLRNAA